MIVTHTAATADVRASFAEKVERGIFQPVSRRLRGEIAEDRLAEGVGMAFLQYVRSCDRGAPMNDALLVEACHRRATDLGRRLAGADGSQPKRDVYDPRNYHEGRVEVLHLDGQEGDEEDEGYVLALADVDVGQPARWLHSALDLQAWLSQLAAGDRLLLRLRRAGFTLEEIAKTAGKSITTVLKRLRELGKDLAAQVDEVTWLEVVS